MTKSIPANSIVGGNPARVIGRTEDFATKVIEESLQIPDEWPNAEVKRKTIDGLLPHSCDSGAHRR